jgi:hypothetical protein
MPLMRQQFLIYVQDGDQVRELTATITHQDMLRGERAMLESRDLDLGHALQLTTAWCWSALMRQGDYAGAWTDFRDLACQGVEKLGEVEVDPTPTATADGPP